MTDHLAVSMRASSLSARECMNRYSEHGFARIQIDSLHPDFHDLTDSGRRDLVATLRRNGLRASGVDFLTTPTTWEQHIDETIGGFVAAISMAEVLGRVPVSVCVPEDEEIIETVIAIGAAAGVLVAANCTLPLENPNIAWGLPLALLAKEERPMQTLARATFGPIALRLSGDVLDRTTLEIHNDTIELTELRGVLDAMRWNPVPVIDGSLDNACEIASAWQSAGPY